MAEDDSIRVAAKPAASLRRSSRATSGTIKFAASDLPMLIASVHPIVRCAWRACGAAGDARAGVPVRRSVQRDYVVCLECG